MYARGMSQRDIAETIEDIYGFEISHEMISQITDCVLDELGDWQNRPLKRMYTFLFVDCMYVTIRKEYESKNYAVYTILGYDTNGEKDILGLWLNESESKHTWMQIFDELKTRGVEDVLFISMDGVSGLEEGAFPNENALLKLLYLRITELYKKWNGSKVQNWAMVKNQLATNDKIKARIEKYEHLI